MNRDKKDHTELAALLYEAIFLEDRGDVQPNISASANIDNNFYLVTSLLKPSDQKWFYHAAQFKRKEEYTDFEEKFSWVYPGTSDYREDVNKYSQYKVNINKSFEHLLNELNQSSEKCKKENIERALKSIRENAELIDGLDRHSKELAAPENSLSYRLQQAVENNGETYFNEMMGGAELQLTTSTLKSQSVEILAEQEFKGTEVFSNYLNEKIDFFIRNDTQKELFIPLFRFREDKGGHVTNQHYSLVHLHKNKDNKTSATYYDTIDSETSVQCDGFMKDLLSNRRETGQIENEDLKRPISLEINRTEQQTDKISCLPHVIVRIYAILQESGYASSLPVNALTQLVQQKRKENKYSDAECIAAVLDVVMNQTETDQQYEVFKDDDKVVVTARDSFDEEMNLDMSETERQTPALDSVSTEEGVQNEHSEMMDTVHENEPSPLYNQDTHWNENEEQKYGEDRDEELEISVADHQEPQKSYGRLFDIPSKERVYEEAERLWKEVKEKRDPKELTDEFNRKVSDEYVEKLANHIDETIEWYHDLFEKRGSSIPSVEDKSVELATDLQIKEVKEFLKEIEEEHEDNQLKR